MSLPASWAIVPMGKIIDLKYGKSLPEKVRSGTGFPVYGSNGVVGWHEPPLTESAAIVIGRKGSVGEVNYSSVPCFPIDTTYYVDDVPGGVLKFWYYQLKNLGLGGLNKSTAIPGLSRSDAYLLDVKFPPVNEQHRIVDKLDRVLARIDAVNENLSRVGFLLKRFRQTVLRAAVSGQLTDGWRSKNDERGWSWCRLADVANVGTGSTPLKSNSNYYSFRGIPWVTSSATGADFIEESGSYVTELALKECRLKIYPPGTLVVAMYGEGKTRGQVSELMLHAAVNQACASVEVVSNLIDVKFLKIFLQANYEKMRLMAEGGNQPNLSLSKIKNLSVPLPSVEEQREIVRQVSWFMTQSKGIERRLAAIRSVSDELTPALLTKAFCGELVPQKLDDEPASELLARVFEAKASENHKPTRRKRQALA